MTRDATGLIADGDFQAVPSGFFIFIFLFFTKIYFRVGNLQKYTPAVPLPGGRDLAARQPGGRGLSAKKDDKNCRQVPGDRSPGSRAAGLIFCNLALFAK